MQNIMRAAFYYNNDDVRVEELPVPAIDNNELLVEVFANGLCGTDVMWDYRKPRVEESLRKTGRGLVLGHEIAGRVVEAGENVKRHLGKRVVVAHHVACGECSLCRNGHETSCDLLRKTNVDPGGLSEYIRVPRENLEKGFYELPDHITYDEASMVEPLGCAIRGQRKAGVQNDHSILILGSGIAGILHLKLAKATNPQRKVYMTDVDKYRLQKAKELGATDVIDARENVFEKLKELNGGGVDCVIVCAGSQDAANQAVQCVGKGGTILYFAGPKHGVSVPLSVDKWRDEIRIVHAYGAANSDMREALQLISSGKVSTDDMITHLLPLDEVQKGFSLIAHPVNSLKVIIQPNSRVRKE